MKGACAKCHNKRKGLRGPAGLLKDYGQVTDGSLEKLSGDNTITYYGRYWEKQFSAINEKVLEEAIFKVSEEQPEPDLDSEPMNRRPEDLEFSPTQKTADIFFMRFFLGKSYVEIGEKYGMDHRTAASYYSHGLTRLNEILKILDGRDKAIKLIKQGSKNHLSKHEKAFLLNKVFGFGFREIADLLGYAGPDAIQHKVNEIYNGYRKKYLDADPPEQSAYEGLSSEEIKQRMAF